LQGVLRVSHAEGARTVIFNPRGGQPLLYGVGAISAEMAEMDRQVLALRRHENEVVLDSAESIQTQLGLVGEENFPINALHTFPMQAAGRLLGVLWVGGLDKLDMVPAQLAVVRSLTNQAAVLVANARLNAQAEQGARRLNAVLDSTVEPVAVIDQTNRFYLVNRALADLLGVDAAEIKSRQVRDVVTDEQFQRVLMGKIEDMNGSEISAENDQIFTAGVSQIATSDEDLVGRIVVLHDITRLKQVDALKTEFVSNVSHDLRNPLVYMGNYVNMLGSVGDLNEKQEEYVGHIAKGIDRMHMLISSLLDLSRIESDEGLEISTIDTRSLLEETVETHVVTTELTEEAFVVDVSEPSPQFEGDVWLVRMAINNLIANALKFAGDSGPIRLSASETEADVIISVADDGPGISADDIEQLFDKFYRAAQPATPQVSGSGLGLAIVKSVTDRHAGRTWCESQMGEGSTFYLAFPKARITEYA
jgi:two-component system NtrC family sensor kinase